MKGINPLTFGACCQKRIFLTFWTFSAWIWAKLAASYSKRHLQRVSISMPFFPGFDDRHGSLTVTGLINARRESDLRLLDFRLFTFFIFYLRLSFFSFSYLFAAVIDLLLSLHSVQKFPRKHHRDGQFRLPWNSKVSSKEILH